MDLGWSLFEDYFNGGYGFLISCNNCKATIGIPKKFITIFRLDVPYPEKAESIENKEKDPNKNKMPERSNILPFKPRNLS